MNRNATSANGALELRRARASGMSLIEVMVAMVIGLVLILGATQVYVNSRSTYVTNETVARLQETARYAVSIIEPDVRMANYWGLLKGAGWVAGQSSQTAAAATGLAGTAATMCGTNFAVDLNTNLQGDNDGYTLGCAAYGAGAVASADTLTIRRASTAPSSVPLTNKKVLRICTSRTDGSLVNDASGCTAGPTGQVNDLVVHTYYVDQDSDQQAGLPSLRYWHLDNNPASAGAPQFLADEIVPGVEDMQIQFGIDPSGTSGIATQYVDAVGPATLGTAQIVAVRIWLLVRADTPETGFKDTRTYIYGNRLTANGTTSSLNSAGAAGKAYAPADGFRRLLISRTIMIRNALGT